MRWLLVIAIVALAPATAWAYAFDSYGGIQGRWGLPQEEKRRWSDATFTWWYDETTETAAFSGHQADAQTGMDYWSIWSAVSIPVAESAAKADADVRISWEAMETSPGVADTGTLALTGPVFDSTTGDLLYADMRFNSNVAGWTGTGFLDVMQHEFGHVLGLVDMYDDASNTVIDFVDHPAGGDKAAKPTALMADNVMYGYGTESAASIRLFDNDDIYGVNWLYGGDINVIATAEWETVLGSDPGRDGILGNADDYSNYFKVADHHGIADGTAEHTWNYAVTIGAPSLDRTLIEIPAFGVWAAGLAGFDLTGWTTEILTDIVRFMGPADFTGNLLLSLTSDSVREGLVAAKVNTQTFDQKPGVGRQFWPMIWAPIPEPAALALFAVGLLGLGVLRRCRAGELTVRRS